MVVNYEYIDDNNIDIFIKYQILPFKKDNFRLFCYGFQKTEKIEQELNILVELIDDFDKNIFFLELKYLKEKYKIFKILKEIEELEATNLKGAKIIDNLFYNLFRLAIIWQSSDIHIELNINFLDIRFRIKGDLVLFFRLDKSFFQIISTVIKIFTNLEITFANMPQDARFSYKIDNKIYDFRVSIMPLIEGESIVIRILDKEKGLISLDDLGFLPNTLNIIKNKLSLYKGLILVTGPTGSGKTTTLYAMIKYLNNGKRKIITIEEPVEYNLEGVNQINVNESIGFDFATALKSILRQDPDIILVGEIRDAKTLQIAIQASLTGHLVLATLHTNNSIDTILRLFDLGAKEYLVANVLRLIIAQRLIKIVCQNCKGSGCEKCYFSGTEKRKLVSEIIEVDKDIYKMILEKDLDSLKSIKILTLKEQIFNMYKKGLILNDEYAKYQI